MRDIWSLYADSEIIYTLHGTTWKPIERDVVSYEGFLKSPNFAGMVAPALLMQPVESTHDHDDDPPKEQEHHDFVCQLLLRLARCYVVESIISRGKTAYKQYESSRSSEPKTTGGAEYLSGMDLWCHRVASYWILGVAFLQWCCNKTAFKERVS